MYSQLISCGIPLYFMGESGTVCTVTQHVYSANLDQTGNYDDDHDFFKIIRLYKHCYRQETHNYSK